MHRDRFTIKLIRIVESIESGKLPMDVRELYVFGSYSRGALEPGDLDLIIVHSTERQEIDLHVERLLRESEFSLLEQLRLVTGKQNAARMKLFRNPGEAVQIIFTTDIGEVTGEGSRISPADPLLIWSSCDRNWRNKIDAILPNQNAGRAARNHLIELKRLGDDVFEMEFTVKLIENKTLLVTRIPVDTIAIKLGAYHKKFLNHWTENCQVMGKESMKTLPYVMWWFEQNRDRCLVPDRTEVWNFKHTLRCEVGRGSLRWMRILFQRHPKLKRQCLIPHFKRKGPNELFVFERGPNWNVENLEDIDN